MVHNPWGVSADPADHPGCDGPTFHRVLQTIATMIAAAGALLAALALRASQRQRLRQFEAVYVVRYWSLMDGLTLAAMRGEPGAEEDPENEKKVRAYLRLCEDQCEMRAAGWISDATWKLWSEGMADQLEREPFAAVWGKVGTDTSQFVMLRDLLENNFAHHEPSRSRRLFNGLLSRTGV